MSLSTANSPKLSPVSDTTHKQYKIYSKKDVTYLIHLISCIVRNAWKGTPYKKSTFLQHAQINKQKLSQVSKSKHIEVPATILFWLRRATLATKTSSNLVLPHICKVTTSEGEKFYVTNRADWQKHREATKQSDKSLVVSDHCILQYLRRVHGLDIDAYLKGFPKETLTKQVNPNNRIEVSVGDFTYIIEGNTCVTVLSAGMAPTETVP